jgi:hypothetical protein
MYNSTFSMKTYDPFSIYIEGRHINRGHNPRGPCHANHGIFSRSRKLMKICSSQHYTGIVNEWKAEQRPIGRENTNEIEYASDSGKICGIVRFS